MKTCKNYLEYVKIPYICALQRFNVLRKIMILRKRKQMYVGVTREGLPGAGLVPQSPKKQKRVIQTAQPCRLTNFHHEIKNRPKMLQT